MADTKAESASRTATTTSSSMPNGQPPPSAARFRLQHRPSTASSPPHPVRRRSSLLSFSSLEGATQSFADDIINPSTNNHKPAKDDDQVTHWHSTPLAFAILPAVGGLLFKNGSAFVTDVLLLGLAAIFMNWSIRLPWDWYYSAQLLRQEGEPGGEIDDTIAEVPETDEIAIETASSSGNTPPQFPVDGGADSEPFAAGDNVTKRQEAAADLRQQELLALLATFVFPMLAAYLLHVIRAQLSRPSTNLVSDYNLSIFILAAEIRPCRQLVRLLSHRTLHLQRVVSGNEEPFASLNADKGAIGALASRISELEARLSDHTLVPPTMTIAQKADISDLSAEVRKRYEPRLEGLERAVRRYEKRSTTLAMLTEQRLQALENRTNDALSLAAVAAQHSQHRGVFATLLQTLTAVILFPIRLTWNLCVWPFAVVEEIYVKLKTVLLGPQASKVGSKRGVSGKYNGAPPDEKPRVKGQGRKVIR